MKSPNLGLRHLESSPSRSLEPDLQNLDPISSPEKFKHSPNLMVKFNFLVDTDSRTQHFTTHSLDDLEFLQPIDTTNMSGYRIPPRGLGQYQPQTQALHSYVESSGPNLDLATQEQLATARARAQQIQEELRKNQVKDEDSYADLDLDQVQKSKEITGSHDDDNIDRFTYFDDFLVAQFYREILRPKSLNIDKTIPTNADDMKAHVRLLVRAFKSVNNAEDNDNVVKPFKERRHESDLTEIVCWGILRACIARSQSDEPLVRAYEPLKASHKNSSELNTFAKRFDAIVNALARSKTMSTHLFQVSYVNVFVDNPLQAGKRVASNRKLNKNKSVTMKKGKEVLEKEGKFPTRRARKRSASVFEEDDDEDQSDFIYSPSTRKITRRRVTPSTRSLRSNASASSIREQKNYIPTPTSAFNGYNTDSPSPFGGFNIISSPGSAITKNDKQSPPSNQSSPSVHRVRNMPFEPFSQSLDHSLAAPTLSTTYGIGEALDINKLLLGFPSASEQFRTFPATTHHADSLNFSHINMAPQELEYEEDVSQHDLGQTNPWQTPFQSPYQRHR